MKHEEGSEMINHDPNHNDGLLTCSEVIFMSVISVLICLLIVILIGITLAV